jgi:hypothetical protein
MSFKRCHWEIVYLSYRSWKALDCTVRTLHSMATGYSSESLLRNRQCRQRFPECVVQFEHWNLDVMHFLLSKHHGYQKELANDGCRSAGVHGRLRWLLWPVWWNVFYGTFTRTKYQKYLLYCRSSGGRIWNSILDSIYLLGIDWSTVTDWWLMGKKLLMPVNTPLTALRIIGGVINKDLVP